MRTNVQTTMLGDKQGFRNCCLQSIYRSVFFNSTNVFHVVCTRVMVCFNHSVVTVKSDIFGFVKSSTKNSCLIGKIAKILRKSGKM